MDRSKAVIALSFMLCLVAIGGCGGCGRKGQENTTVNIITEKSYAEGLNLVAVGELVKKSSDAKTLEEELNKPNSINNIDLNEDGKVDYLKVTEYGKENIRGLSITDDISKDETQEIATIEISKTNNTAEMAINGNSTVYRDPGTSYYHSSFGLTDLIILGYLFGPRHTYWASPYGYGMYPSYYRPYMVAPPSMYSNRMTTFTKTTRFAASPAPAGKTTMSPNAGRNSTTFQRKITEAHKSFEARKSGKSVGSGGFGNNKGSSPSMKSSRPSTPSAPRSAPFRSSRSFGRRR
jgi:hypothetical protein